MALTSLVLFLTLLFMTCSGLTVDPPEDLSVFDSGRLGYLDITWSPPSSLVNLTKCQIQYQLEYFNSFRNQWAVLRTTKKSYRAQFDLSKDVSVRVYTLMDGPCADNKMQMSENYTQLVQKPPSTGIADTEAKDFTCVFYNMERVECMWTRSLRTPADSQLSLYYWCKLLELAVECPKYILSGGVRSGCQFPRNSLAEFSDIIFCVNGSSSEGSLKPVFASLQIQNHIKPAAVEKMDLKTSSDEQLELLWENPVRILPGHCMEWEVEHSHERPDGNRTLRTIEIEETTSLTLPFSPHMERDCFRIRSKLSTYCVDKSLRSDWSDKVCYPEKVKAAPELKSNLVPVYICIIVAVTILLVVSVCVWATIIMKKTEPEKKLDSLLASLFAKTSAFAAPTIFKGKNVCADIMI
ncbi:interleukin-13 receptor subunit alpha-2 [Austrofundulus limnaeus]|uniref:Interleukin-13 receptor subunit alpha-2 n=1 Tax=Austrofundulus limnaeus TaxID=52670 RepID=A0A2I4B2X3_AUSLI|nr:PREDICTED: interleukin-13 receptor subunit alpha-2-like [Austrofundulus limnaeus]